MASDKAEANSKAPRRTSSKYDFVKVKVWIGENSDHYYVLSRFLVSRMLTVTKISNVVAIKIALELKKLLVDNNLLDVSQADLEANLFKLMQKRGYGEEYVNRYKMMTNFHHQRVPLLVLVGGTACVGKSTIATQLAQRLNLPNVLQTDIIYELLRTDPNNAAPLNATPLWARTDVTSTEDLMQEFRRECRVIRKGVDGDLTKTMSDGKPLIMEGLHLDPGIYLTELPQMRIKNPGRLKQSKVHPSENLRVPQSNEKRDFSPGESARRKGSNLEGQACSVPGSRFDKSGLSSGLRSAESGLSQGLANEEERDGARAPKTEMETEKRRRSEKLTSASGSGWMESRTGEAGDGSNTTGRTSVTGRKEQRRSRRRMQSLDDAKEFLKALATRNFSGGAETRAESKGGVRKSASSCHVAGECGTSPGGTEPSTSNERPQISPRGRSDAEVLVGRSTDSNSQECAAEATSRCNAVSTTRLETDTPVAESSTRLDTGAPGAGGDQLEASAGVNPLGHPANSTVLSPGARTGAGGLEARPAGREPLSSTAQPLAADNCAGSDRSRGGPKSGFGPTGRGSLSGNRSSLPSESPRADDGLSENRSRAPESRPLGLTPSAAGPSEESVRNSPVEVGLSELSAGVCESAVSIQSAETGFSGRFVPTAGLSLPELPELGAENGLSKPSVERGSSDRSQPGVKPGPSEPCETAAENGPSGMTSNGDNKAGPEEAIVVQIVLRMSEEDHSALLDEWLASRTGEIRDDVTLDKAAVLQKLRTIQDYLCSFEDQGVAVVDVSTTSFAQTLDKLHSHLLDCIEDGWSGGDR